VPVLGISIPSTTSAIDPSLCSALASAAIRSSRPDAAGHHGRDRGGTLDAHELEDMALGDALIARARGSTRGSHRKRSARAGDLQNALQPIFDLLQRTPSSRRGWPPSARRGHGCGGVADHVIPARGDGVSCLTRNACHSIDKAFGSRDTPAMRQHPLIRSPEGPLSIQTRRSTRTSSCGPLSARKGPTTSRLTTGLMAIALSRYESIIQRSPGRGPTTSIACWCSARAARHAVHAAVAQRSTRTGRSAG
jgi:hypothetical protein